MVVNVWNRGTDEIYVKGNERSVAGAGYVTDKEN
jgi:hypothetical protein